MVGFWSILTAPCAEPEDEAGADLTDLGTILRPGSPVSKVMSMKRS